MIAFFTSVGFAASVSLLKRGGPLVLKFLVVATVFAVLQNVIGLLARGGASGSIHCSACSSAQ